MLDIGLCLIYCLCNELLQTFRARKKQTTICHFFFTDLWHSLVVLDNTDVKLWMMQALIEWRCPCRCLVRCVTLDITALTITVRLCVCVCVLVTISYCTNTGAKAAEGAREMLCSSIRPFLSKWCSCIPVTWQCCHSVPSSTDWPANPPVSAWSYPSLQCIYYHPVYSCISV